jgi:uncharacterized protein (TIGR03435 family)
MRYFRLLLALLAADLAVAAAPPATPSVETKLRKLEIRRITGPHRQGQIPVTRAWELCRSRKRSGGGDCHSGRLRQLLEYAFDNEPHRIFGPDWMSNNDVYLFYFEYDVDGPCPKNGRSLGREIFREILVEKFSVTVRREQRVAPVLVMKLSGREPLSPSKKNSCSMESPPVYSEAQPAQVGGLASGLPAITDPNARAAYPLGQPYQGSDDGTVRSYEGCTLTELAGLLESSLLTDVADETGSSDRHNFTLRNTSTNPEQVARQLTEQLGIDAHIERRLLPFVFLDAPLPPKKIEYEARAPVSPVPCLAP